MIESRREIGTAIDQETRFSITPGPASRRPGAADLGPAVRGDRAVDNSLHWVLDMIFRDDECRVRTHHAPANFTTIKYMALNRIRRAPGKDSIRLRRKVAAWDDEFLGRRIAA